MRNFRFSLEAVATIRRHEEQGALDRFAHASLLHRQALDRLAEVQRELDATLEARRHPVETLAIHWAQHQAWQTALEVRAKKQSETVSTTLRALNEANRALMVARQRREAVEKVRVGRKVVHDAEMRRQEQKALDELVHRRTLAQGLLNEAGDGIVGLAP
jgi:flagellar export protein FliJ